ncbi:MAG: putative sulfate exporter family transporter [bacterium]
MNKLKMALLLNNIKEILPGLIVSVVIAIAAYFIGYGLEHLVGLHLIGGSVIALFIGVTINFFWCPKCLKKGLDFASKKLLKFAIILLGGSLSVNMILTVGGQSLVVMVFTLLTCFGGGYIVGKLLKLDWKVSNLISAGTGICGGSAIAAISPVIDAEDNDVAMAMSATFIFDMIMIVLFPIMGFALGLSDQAYGLWAGTAVNDTSSVVAAAGAFSEAAQEYAVMVKLTRTLSIIPVVLIFSFINMRIKRKNSNTEVVEKKKVNIVKIIPWFIVGFLLMAILNSVGLFSESFSSSTKSVSSFIMIIALAAIGMKTSFKEMKASGPRPMLHGFIISTLVVIVALVVEIAMGLVTF